METRLQNVNFENPDELWSVLSDAEKQEFESLVKNGEVEKILPAWTPWWTPSVQKKITELSEENNKDTKLPAIIDVPLFPELQVICMYIYIDMYTVRIYYIYIDYISINSFIIIVLLYIYK